MKRLFTLCCICSLMVLSAAAQDIHFVQFQNTTLNLNPALTGIFNGDIRGSLVMRNQWQSVPVGYKTVTASVENKIFSPNIQNGFFTGALLINVDNSGDSRLGRFNIGLSGAYAQALSKRNVLSIGGQFSFSQVRFDTDRLTFGDQFNGDIFDVSLTSMDQLNTGTVTKFYPDLSTGINWRYQIPEKRTKIDLGVGFFHINQPEQALGEGFAIDLPTRISIHGVATVKVAEKWDAVGLFTNQRQGPNSQFLGGLGAKLWLDQTQGKELAVQLAWFYRFQDESDAWIPGIQVEYAYWTLGFNYDVNVSGFSVATNRRGGPELSLAYRLQKVRPFTTKICPIF